MTSHFFAIRVEEHRLVAAEIGPPAAARLLDTAQPLLLGSAEDLANLAQRLGLPLVIIARAGPRRPSVAGRDATETLRPAPAESSPVPETGGLLDIRWRVARWRDRMTARVA